MKFTACDLPGLIVIEPTVFGDSRGYFFEAYNESLFHKNGIDYKFVQDNQSRSSHGVIRGLHFQLNPFAQVKLVRVLEGAILDVAVDIRKGSPTFGKYFSVELTSENKKQLLIPAGFAHGFSVLSETASVLYKCNQFYNKESEGGIRFDDPALNIDWQVDLKQAVVSSKDIELPLLKDCVSNFEF
ncbi:dTDP-4-dehydrorhamnose 3,5-epimerase [Flavisolibacter tropicus]|uniref:dTDP-4-dehydrorhamnose 3,5-epimerase n=1 Tax=Flavisolibacter tropicus TaxID=1492898 RepID=A0A172TU00_9BACT|nr:dTDP-4-dehydrorhamnose 3,5-epimerase [Flavisolibacter tropicus]ANE50253.1 dTDP-4-dehydrorhamnose 3,5-epimerase [Flavisolibacter tropicus]